MVRAAPRLVRPLAFVLPLLLLVPACASPEVAVDPDPAASDVVEAPAAATSSGTPSEPATPSTDSATCAPGTALADAALLARAPQGEAAVVDLSGTLRIVTRTCDGSGCKDELPRDQSDVKLTLTRADDGKAWRGQISPASNMTIALAIDAAGGVSGELALFGDGAASAALDGVATTSCLGVQATAKRDVGGGKRVETTIRFTGGVPEERPRVVVGEEPPVPTCDQSAPVDSVFQTMSAAGGRLVTEQGPALEQFRDCRAATGCKPWQVGVVGVDGSSPWSRAAAATTAPLTVAGRTEPSGRLVCRTTIANSANQSASFVTVYPTFTTDVPLLGRAASTDAKIAVSGLVVREAGGARAEATDPRIRSRRYACLPYAK
jgi:hypothetical protein